MKRIWELLPNLFAAVRKTHEKVGLAGAHDFVHAARVGEIAWQIASFEWPEEDEDIAFLAGAAGFCHNADRILQKQLGVGRNEVPETEIMLLAESWLNGESFFHGQQWDIRQYRVIDAVLKHGGKNSPDDSKVLIALMDADRIVNLDTDLFIRAGQHYHDIPAVDYKNFLDDPAATYSDPKSVLKDVSYSLDWVDPESSVHVRTCIGKRLAKKRADVFCSVVNSVVNGLREQLAEEGILPYHF